MGVVIASGLAIGTLFTLFVVPAVYMVLSGTKNAPAVTPERQAAPAYRS
jgi:multidrug efflux pump